MSVIYMIINEIRHIIIPCLISLPVIVLIRFIIYKKNNKCDLKREAVIVLFWLYIVALLSVTFVPEFSLKTGINASVFHLPDFSNPDTVNFHSPRGWILWKINQGNYADLIRNIIGNVVVFVPFGILFPVIFKKLENKTILFGFLLSFFIEFCQLFMNRQSDIYDLIMNTVGVFIGYLIYIIIKKKKSKA